MCVLGGAQNADVSIFITEIFSKVVLRTHRFLKGSPNIPVGSGTMLFIVFFSTTTMYIEVSDVLLFGEKPLKTIKVLYLRLCRITATRQPVQCLHRPHSYNSTYIPLFLLSITIAIFLS